MPYTSVDQLPESVKNSLPKHAQDIYRSAFNSAWSEYGPGHATERRNPKDDPEEVAHRVAWAAVKKKYKRIEEGAWKERH